MNTFYHGDCLFVMEHDIQPESVDLIYLDPPFFTGQVQKATAKWRPGAMEISYDDSKKFWSEKAKDMQDNAPHWLKHIAVNRPDFASYLYYMMVRLQACHKVLKKTGSIYLHCDWRASHYLKMIMDEVFGDGNFQNEIIWGYGGGGTSSARFGRKHDIILWYSKSCKFIFNHNSVRVPYITNNIGPQVYHPDVNKKALKHIYTYIPNPEGKVSTDTWTDITKPYGPSGELVGYPTQKPVALLERIIKASSNEGDLLLDPFCGCGTAIVAAHKLNRRWVGIDINEVAYKTIQSRSPQMPLGMKEEFAHFKQVYRDLPKVMELNADDFEKWVNEFYGATKPHPDTGIDGVTRDGVGIQTKTTQKVSYNVISQLVQDAKYHPLTTNPVTKVICVSQNNFDNKARQRKFEVEQTENIKVELVTPEEMLKL